MSDEEPIIQNDKKLWLDLCLRNAVRYARGEIKYTRDLHNQLIYAYENCGYNTRQVMKQIFDMARFDEP